MHAFYSASTPGMNTQNKCTYYAFYDYSARSCQPRQVPVFSTGRAAPPGTTCQGHPATRLALKCCHRIPRRGGGRQGHAYFPLQTIRCLSARCWQAAPGRTGSRRGLLCAAGERQRRARWLWHDAADTGKKPSALPSAACWSPAPGDREEDAGRRGDRGSSTPAPGHPPWLPLPLLQAAPKPSPRGSKPSVCSVCPSTHHAKATLWGMTVCVGILLPPHHPTACEVWAGTARLSQVPTVPRAEMPPSAPARSIQRDQITHGCVEQLPACPAPPQQLRDTFLSSLSFTGGS